MANNSPYSEAMDPLTVPPLSAMLARQRSGGQRPGRTDGKAFGLPDGWTVETKARAKEGYQGVVRVDRYFFEPKTNRRFRSLKAVKRHLELNLCVDDTSKTIQRRRAESNGDDSNASSSSIKRARKRIRGCEYYNFDDRPTSVTLVSTTEKNELDPFMGQIRVQERIRRFWEDTFFALSCPNNAYRSQ